MKLFGWRRRSEGFEWREHVRTTILLRRARRQRRIDDAREAAIARVQDVRDKGIEAGRAGVNLVADHASQTASTLGQKLWALMATAAVAGWNGSVSAARFIRQRIADLDLVRIERTGDQDAPARAPDRIAQASTPRESTPRESTGIDGPDEHDNPVRVPRGQLAERLKRARDVADAEIVDIPLVKPEEPRRRAPVQPRRDANFEIGENGKRVAGFAAKAAAVVAVIIFGGQALQSRRPAGDDATAPVTTAAITPETSNRLQGRAAVETGDRVTIAGRTLQIDGIAAPLLAQSCRGETGKVWRCGVSAKSALETLVRAKQLSCDVIADAANGEPARARCAIAGADVSTALLNGGHVFASSDATYDHLASEQDARSASRGVWSGENVHPTEWRDKVWAEAKAKAPKGCPIRGYRSRGVRLYVMPWSASYGSRSARRTRQWFCSENEAQLAGYKPADPTGD